MLSYNNLLAAKVLIFYDTPKVFINYFIGVHSPRCNVAEGYFCFTLKRNAQTFVNRNRAAVSLHAESKRKGRACPHNMTCLSGQSDVLSRQSRNTSPSQTTRVSTNYDNQLQHAIAMIHRSIYAASSKLSPAKMHPLVPSQP